MKEEAKLGWGEQKTSPSFLIPPPRSTPIEKPVFFNLHLPPCCFEAKKCVKLPNIKLLLFALWNSYKGLPVKSLRNSSSQRMSCLVSLQWYFGCQMDHSSNFPLTEQQNLKKICLVLLTLFDSQMENQIWEKTFKGCVNHVSHFAADMKQWHQFCNFHAQLGSFYGCKW